MAHDKIRDEIKAALATRGWASRPAFPHIFYHPTLTETRFVFRDHVLRKEILVKHESSPNEWIRFRSGYYRDLSVNAEGKLRGLK